jgi:biopolymer transport protein ExbD/biopolymer transport protein TolR
MAFTTRGGHTQTSLAEINITPLVDVVLVLLVIFMLTAPVLQSGIQVSVPHTKTVREITQQRTVVTIDKDQQVYLNDKLVNLNDLPDLLRSQNTDTTHTTVYLRADAKVSWGAIATVMDAVKSSGITNVSVVTQPMTTK